MTINTAHIVSHYAQPKPRGFQWDPRPLRLAKKHPLPSLRERTLSAQHSTHNADQPVVRVQDENHEERSLIEAKMEATSDEDTSERELGVSLPEASSSGDPTLSATNPELPIIHFGISPEDFLRNALPVTHSFAEATAASGRLDATSSHRLRSSSSMSNISSRSSRSRPPSAMSTNGQVHRSSSRASLRHAVTSSPDAVSS